MSSAATKTNSSAEWFENVENFRPLRGGRRAGALNEVAASGTAKVSIDEAERRFLKEFTEAYSLPDPLEQMSHFVRWFDDQFPSGKQKYFSPILYKICTTFSTLDAHKNDERLMKMWFKLVENFPESGLAVMEFAFTRGSCRQLAKFYIFWSQMYQSISWWNKAREKLQLGLKMHAMPLDALHRASDELEAAVMMATCHQPADGDANEWPNEGGGDQFGGGMATPEISRETLGKLRGIGRRHLVAPIMRVPQGPPGKIASSASSAHQSSTTTMRSCGKQRRGKADNLDRFNIFTDEQRQGTLLEEESVTGAAAFDFKTPIGPPRVVKKKASRIAAELANDSDYQALFGTFDEKIDLQITNEENQLVIPTDTPCILADIPAAPALRESEFQIYQDPEEESEKNEKKEEEKAKAGGGKAKFVLRKELIREMSMEEAMGKRILFN